jgi:GT2 family glycosyltransferase
MISAVILNFKTPEKTKKCVESLKSKPNISNIIVVNNDTEDDSLNLIDLKNSDIVLHIIHTGENLGYARGNNFGVKFILNNNIEASHILIANSDIIVPVEFSFTPLIKAISSDSRIGIISPKIIELNSNKSQGPYLKEFILFSFLESVFPILFFARKIFSKYYFKKSKFVYRTMGSFLFVELEVFKKINFFDSNTFLGSEEDILAEKLKLVNKKFYYYNNQFVFHDHGYSRKKIDSKLIDDYFLKSKIYYFTNYRKNVNIKMLVMTYKIKNFLNNYKW